MRFRLDFARPSLGAYEGKDSGLVVAHQIRTKVRAAESGRDILQAVRAAELGKTGCKHTGSIFHGGLPSVSVSCIQ